MHVLRAEEDMPAVLAERSWSEQWSVGFVLPDFVSFPTGIVRVKDAAAIAEENPAFGENRRAPEPGSCLDLPARAPGFHVEPAQAPVDRRHKHTLLAHRHGV